MRNLAKDNESIHISLGVKFWVESVAEPDILGCGKQFSKIFKDKRLLMGKKFITPKRTR